MALSLGKLRAGTIADRPDESAIFRLPLDISQGNTERALSIFLYAISGFVALVLLIAALAPVRELAVANGQLAPETQIRNIQHLEGGIVAELLVEPGEIVEKDQVLLRLATESVNADLRQLEARAASLEFQMRRLTTPLGDKTVDFGPGAEKHPEIAKEQQRLHGVDAALFRSERQTIVSRIAQREAEAEGLKAEQAGIAGELNIAREQLSMREKYLAQGYSPRQAYLEAKARVLQLEAKLAQGKSGLVSARQALDEEKSRLIEHDAGSAQKRSEQLAGIVSDRAEVLQTISKHRDRSSRVEIRAPVRGLVQDLVPTSVGSVVSPGEPIASIVPMDAPLVAEVRVSPEDVAHIGVGNDVRLKITAFDPELFGPLEGRIQLISPSTYQTEKGDMYYKAIVAVHDQSMRHNGESFALLPGMEVHAEIVTGAKSLLRYMLKPLFRSMDVAFSER